MPIFLFNNYQVYYEFQGEPDSPVVAFVNGLTQRTKNWALYTKQFTKAGFRVLTFDLLGQGNSAKPILDVNFESNSDLLYGLLNHLQIDQAYVMGISFGGVIVLRFGIDYPERAKGLVPMSAFSEMDHQLWSTGGVLYEGMTRVGFEYLIRLLIPLNFSANWIAKNQDALAILQRIGAARNELYGIQNLMESLKNFRGFTEELDQIQSPTLIMNGEYDSFTPRSCHEILRQKIKNSRLVLMQHVYHAFTLEIPEVTCRVLIDFVEQVESESWQGDQSVWVANDDITTEDVMYPCPGDHTRAIPT